MFFLELVFSFLLVTPPKIEVDFTITFTSSGTKILIPPNILEALITISFSIIASLKSNLIPPKHAVTSLPLNFLLLKFTSCPEKAAK